jgi:hypothetical protein
MSNYFIHQLGGHLILETSHELFQETKPNTLLIAMNVPLSQARMSGCIGRLECFSSYLHEIEWLESHEVPGAWQLVIAWYDEERFKRKLDRFWWKDSRICVEMWMFDLKKCQLFCLLLRWWAYERHTTSAVIITHLIHFVSFRYDIKRITCHRKYLWTFN